MGTRSVVPRATGEGGLGTTALRWLTGFINTLTVTTINALTLAAASVGFTIAGGTTSKTLTVTADTALDEAVAMSSKAPKASPSFSAGIGIGGIAAGAGGIAFPATQVPVADPNTLDDYEEGTWTLTINRETPVSGVTYTEQTGYYIKIGKIIFIIGHVAWSAITGAGAGNNAIGGFPFSGGISQKIGNMHFISSPGVATLPVLEGFIYNTIMYMRKSANILAATNINEDYSAAGAFTFEGFYII